MLYLIGLGGAGSRIVDGLYKKGVVDSIIGRLSGRNAEGFTGIAADTSDSISRLGNIPGKHLILIGGSGAKGHGAGGDRGLGKKIMEEESSLVLNTLRKAASEEPEALLIIAGLGGGTGTGGCKVLASKLKKAYRAPVIGLFTLPSRAEGALYLRNASEGIEEAVGGMDGAVLFDTDVLTMRGEDVPSAHRLIDKAISSLLGVFDRELAKAVLGATSAAGFKRFDSEQVLAKDALFGMLREDVYIKEVGGAEGAVVLARGDISRLHGQEVAEKWCRKRFKMGVEYVLEEDKDAKDLRIVTVIRGIRDIKKKLDEIQSGAKEETRPGFEELLEDIKPVF